VLAEAEVCNLQHRRGLPPRLRLLQFYESVFELQVAVCEALVMDELDTGNELLEEEASHVLIKAIRSFHSLKQLSSCCILQHDAQVLVSEEHLQLRLFIPTVGAGPVLQCKPPLLNAQDAHPLETNHIGMLQRAVHDNFSLYVFVHLQQS
jgi:hypothetical protein